jgi:hypothetical protein
MPPAVSMEMAKGFTLYMVKAVTSGRGGRVDRSRPNEPVHTMLSGLLDNRPNMKKIV